MFSYSNIQRVADTFRLPRGVSDIECMFSQCLKLEFIPETFRIPHSVLSLNNFLNGCGRLSANISHWFDDIIPGQNGNKRIHQSFYQCSQLTGTPPADKLWLDGSWTWNSANASFGDTFTQCNKLSNYDKIPDTWK